MRYFSEIDVGCDAIFDAMRYDCHPCLKSFGAQPRAHPAFVCSDVEFWVYLCFGKPTQCTVCIMWCQNRFWLNPDIVFSRNQSLEHQFFTLIAVFSAALLTFDWCFISWGSACWLLKFMNISLIAKEFVLRSSNSIKEIFICGREQPNFYWIFNIFQSLEK